MQAERKKRSWKKRLIGWCLVLVVFLLFAHWQNKSIHTTEYTYQSEQVPKGFDGYRIVQISDLHNDVFGKNQKNLLQAVRDAKPDIIVITGDLIDGNNPDVEDAMTAVRGLPAIAPVYYCIGNHEQYVPIEYRALEQGMLDCGVTMLVDASVTLTQGSDQITLTGLDNESHVTSAQKKLIEAVKTPFSVVLVHNPMRFDELSAMDVDLAFSGHAHGGQFRFPGIDGLYAPDQGAFPKLTSGLHEQSGTTMAISRGIGNSAFPLRLFNFPELVVMTLQTQP